MSFCSGTSSNSRTLAFALTLFIVVALFAIQAASAKADATYTQVSTGINFGCGVLETGNIECWGQNGSGQLGDGTTTDRSRPTDVNTPPGATEVSAGSYTTCAVVSGAAWCWGAGYNGQLGIPGTPNIGQPRMVTDLGSGVTSISTGGSVSCAVVSGAAKCWGHGYLGNGGFNQSDTPVQVQGLESGVQSIAVGDGGSACAIDGNLNVRCWGQGGYGQLGNGSATSQGLPVFVSSLTDATGIDVGNDFACAVRDPDGAVLCWGNGYYGTLGHGSFGSSYVPVAVTGISAGASEISTGTTHTCAVVAPGAMCWGNNDRQQIGGSSSTKESSPVQVAGITSGVTSIAAGDKFSCATVGGDLTCWGSNSDGQLGIGTSAGSPTPTEATGLGADATDVASGDTHSCAIISGAARCWGANQSGQLGTGDTVGSQTPTQVVGLTSGVTSISAGASFTCAIVSGAAYCWGSSGNGGLGGGWQTTFTSPNPVVGLSSGVSKIVASDSSACAIVNGGAKCWGNNGAGQLGTGNTTSTNTPVDVSGLQSGVTDIAIADDHACAVVDGAAKCWGNGGQGGIGLGDWSSTTTPAQVPGLETGVTGVGAGDNYSCYLQNGGVLCTGVNYNGQLGTGNSAYFNSPAQVVGLASGVTQISVGVRSSCAIGSFGTRCWGLNSNGESGSGSANEYLQTPADVTPAFMNVSKVSMGRGHACAIDSGAVKCWGSGESGELGNGNAYTGMPQIALQPVDTAGPLVTFSSPAEGSTVTDPSTEVSFAITDNSGAVSSIMCRTNASAWVDCASPWAPTLAEGDNTVYVQATDGAGNASTSSLSFKLDTQPPAVIISSSGPVDTMYLNQTIGFYSTDPSGIVGSEQCKVDDGAWVDCANSFTATFDEGNHTITVKAVDAHGYVGTSVAVFRVDQTPPVIDVDPVITTTSQSPEINFSVDDANSYTVHCEFAAFYYWFTCESPWAVPYALPDGNHAMAIQAMDAAGNFARKDFTVTVDSVAPPVTIDSPNEHQVLTDKTPDISFTVDNSAGDLATTTCSVDSGAAAACSSPYTTPTLTDGGHWVTVVTTDTLGNSSSAVRNFSIDTTGPDVAIDSFENNEVFDYDQPFIQFSSSDWDATYVCTLDDVLVLCEYGYHQPQPLADGEHNFTVVATDTYGNTSTASVDFIVDTVNPTLSFTTVDGSTVTSRTPQLAFTAADSGSGIDTIECMIDSADEVPCTAPFTPPSLNDGWHSIDVFVNDRAGNFASQGISFYVDATAPGVAITSPASGATTLDRTPTVEFEIDDPDGDLDQVLCKVDAGAFVACGSPFTTGTLADGVHTVTVRVVDESGNSSEDSVSITITSPVVTPPVVTPPANPGTPAAPAVLPLLGKLPSSAKYAKPIKIPLTCAAGCTLQLGLKIGKKKVKVPTLKVAAGATSAKIKFSKSLIKKIKTGAKKKQKSVLTVTPVGAAGTGVPKKIKLK